MFASALGHRLETLQDGLTTFCQGAPVPMPLVGTEINVRVIQGLAIVRTFRSFRNVEDTPIEAIMTFPVGFDAVVTSLVATIDGRRMIGTAKEKTEARETYEAALDEGRLSVLHEEVLRGIHVLSIGALPPGAEVAVELEQVVPLADAGGTLFLRLPMTAGQIYGTSPLLPSDDLVTASGVRHSANLIVTTDTGCVIMNGQAIAGDTPLPILLDRAIELRIEGGTLGKLSGRDADGRTVELSFAAPSASDNDLDLHVIVDRSSSTNSRVRDGAMTVWEAMREGLHAELGQLRQSDLINLWQFESQFQYLGNARGSSASSLVDRLQLPSGGTELAGAVRAAIGKGARDILVLTDGQTWAHLVDELKREEVRISAILVGPSSLDANIGHLCALTGGQVLYAPGRDVASALQTAFATLRAPASPVRGTISEGAPKSLSTYRGGVRIDAVWGEPEGDEADAFSTSLGRFAAALAIPLLDAEAGEAWSRAHSLCTHSTSLVLVDEVGKAVEGFSRMRKVPLMASAGAHLQGAVSFTAIAASIPASHCVSPRYTPRPTEPSWLENARRAVGRWLSRDKSIASPLKVSTFSGFAWDAWGDDLVSGNLSMLTTEQAKQVKVMVERIKSHPRWYDLSSDEQGRVDVIALGVIATKRGDRLAKRFAHRALKGISKWFIQALESLAEQM